MKAQANIKREPVANSYAQAIFDLATESGELTKLQSDFSDLSALLQQNPALLEALSSTIVPLHEREKLLDAFAATTQLHPLLARFLKLLLNKNRISIVQAIFQAFRDLADESQNLLRGTAVSATELTDSQLAELSDAFSRKLNKKVILEPAIDPGILGGIIVKVQGKTYDGSLQTTIRRLRENLERQSI